MYLKFTVYEQTISWWSQQCILSLIHPQQLITNEAARQQNIRLQLHPLSLDVGQQKSPYTSLFDIP